MFKYLKMGQFLLRDIQGIAHQEKTLASKVTIGAAALLMFAGMALANPEEMHADYERLLENEHDDDSE